MSRIFFVNRFFHPDHSATSRLVSDLAFELAAAGRQVVAIASRQKYDDPSSPLAPAETVNGVRIIRPSGFRFGRRVLIGRALDYASFYLGVAWRLARELRAGDVVVFKTDPPMLGPVLDWVARLRRARVVNWLQDLFPQVAVQAGVLGAGTGNLLQWFAHRRLRRADVCVAIGETMAERLAANDIESFVIDNWCDLEALAPRPGAAMALRQEWGLNDRFVVGYSGNLGRAHPIDLLQQVLCRWDTDDSVRFLFTGGGTGYDALRDWCQSKEFRHVLFKPYQPEHRLAALLALPDVHLALLAPQFEGLIVPSKFSAIAAAQRPCLFIGDGDGQIGRWIRQSGCGRVVGDADSLSDAIEHLRSHPGMVREMGVAARRLATRKFDRAKAMERWRTLLDSLTVDTGNGR